MAYDVQGIIGERALILEIAADIDGALPCPLAHGLAFIPMTSPVYRALSRPGGERVDDLSHLPPGADERLAEWSHRAPVGYFGAFFHGGVGGQEAAVWRDGVIVYGPTESGDLRIPWWTWPINGLLVEVLGWTGRERPDLFDRVGLGSNRSNETWAAQSPANLERTGNMIARIWSGWAWASMADHYQRHYETVVAEELRGITGFRGARLLRSYDGGGITFTSITYFVNMAAVRAFAGDDPEQAVVDDVARRLLGRWDERVTHHEVTVEVTVIR